MNQWNTQSYALDARAANTQASNCYYLAGEHHCQWIEPNGYEPNDLEPITQTRIQGIAH